MRRHIATFVLLLVVIGLTCGVGVTLKKVVQKNNEIIALRQENTDLKESIAALNLKFEGMQLPSEEDKNNTQTEEDIPQKESTIPVLDESKIVNKEEGTVIVERSNANNGIVSVTVDNNEKSVSINLNAQIARQVYGYYGQNNTHVIAGFSSKVVDTKITSVGNNADDVKIIFLMEDGNVKYIDIEHVIDRSYTVQTLSEVSDIVRIAEVDVITETNTTCKVVAIKKDGTATILKF